MNIKNIESKSVGKQIVIGGYVLLVVIMLIGLFAIYKNLVDFSEKRIRSEDRQELLIVSNIINQLYEVEASNNLLTFESTEKYINSFHNIRSSVTLRLDSLKLLAGDTARISQLDTIDVLLDRKEDNLIHVFELMDSLRQSPSIVRETSSTYTPKTANASKYIKDGVTDGGKSANADTTVIKREKKGLLRRLGDAFTGKQDSTVIVEKRQSSAIQKDYELVVDTIVNMVRQTERLNLENQRKFQAALYERQSIMSKTNETLTKRVDELLKFIELEEREKALKLVEEKETTLSRSYDTVFWVSIIAVSIAVLFGFLFVLDINRSQSYKRKLEESNTRIKKLLQSREKLMLSISHDIKAPMSSILGYIELIQSGLNKDSHDTYLINMKKSSEHVLQLVSNLLDYQRIESGTWRKNDMQISLKELIDNTTESFEPLAYKKELGYNVINKVPEGVLALGDPLMIREIYSNVISNAIKYTFDGEVVVSVDFDTMDKTLKLSVKDTGVGISDEDKGLVFEEFERIKMDKIEHHEDGTGLGMAITKGLVEQLGGKISFVSEKGVGTEFFVELPMHYSDTVLPKESSIEIDKGICRNKKITILLVDDDAIQQLMVSEMIKAQGISVISETNPNKVVDILKKESFDLIFLDIQMPEINGFTLIKNIIDSGVLKHKPTPIIALTATSEIELHEYKLSGFSGLLNKPFTSSELFDTIEKYIQYNNQSSLNQLYKPKGVESLISYVKDDKESSKAILQSFSKECRSMNEYLKGDNISDVKITSNLAHKMLPLFKMIGDNDVVSSLIVLEKRGEITKEQLSSMINKINFYIEQSDNLSDQIFRDEI